MSDALDLQAILTCIAEQEPLNATLEAFPKLAEEDLRAALRRLARGQAPRTPAKSADPRPSAAAKPNQNAWPSTRAGQPLVVYSDGASRGNPGPSGAGWVICDANSKQIAAGGIYLGRRTNNEAEYLAAAMGLQAASEMGASKVTLRADSELMVRQLQGRYQVKNAKLIPLFRQVKELCDKFDQFTAQHVPRAQNAAADEQANIAIDEKK